MRQNTRGFFHKAIIASVCCMALAGCGHKTSPKYVPTPEEIAARVASDTLAKSLAKPLDSNDTNVSIKG